jgi:hypothetical protein
LNLGHVTFSLVDFATMSDGNNHEPVALGVENDAPVTDAQSRAVPAFEPLHIPVPGLCERFKPRLKASSDVGGEPKPLSRGGGGPNDFHTPHIAYSDISVNLNIAYCDYWGEAA